MATPTKFTPGFDFSESMTPPGVQIDIALAEIAQSIRETVDALGDVRRSDGALKNGIVTAESLSTDFFATLESTLAAVQAVEADVLAAANAASLARTNAENAFAGAQALVAVVDVTMAQALEAQQRAENAEVNAAGSGLQAEQARDVAVAARQDAGVYASTAVSAASTATGAMTATEIAKAAAEDAATTAASEAALAISESVADDVAAAQSAAVTAVAAKKDVLGVATLLEATINSLNSEMTILDWGSITQPSTMTMDWGNIAD